MSLPITFVQSWPCGNCFKPIERNDAVPFSKVICSACNTGSIVPVRLGDIALFRKTAIHPAGDIFVGTEELAERDVTVLACHPADGLHSDIIDATIEINRLMLKVPDPHVLHPLRIGYVGKHPLIVTERLAPTLLQMSNSKAVGKVIIRATMSKVVEALWHAQKLGICHMALSPQCVLLRPEGVRVHGFSPWNFLEKGPRGRWQNLYEQGIIPPEVIANKRPNMESDIWSVGALMFYMATRSYPNEHASPKNALGELRPDLSKSFVKSVMYMLADNPMDRPQSWPQVLNLLMPGLNVPIEAKPDTWGEKGTLPSLSGVHASNHMQQVAKDNRATSTLCGLSANDLPLDIGNAYDQISGLMATEKDMTDMVAEQMNDMDNVSPADLMADKVLSGNGLDTELLVDPESILGEIQQSSYDDSDMPE